MTTRVGVGAVLLAATAAVTAGAGEVPGLSPGATVRITPPERVEVPGLVTVEKNAVRGAGAFERVGDLVSVRSDGRLLHVPVPGTTLAGEYVGTAADSILIRRPGTPQNLEVPRQAVARLEVRRSRGHATAFALAGAAVGFGVGWALGSCDTWGCSPPLWGGVFAIPGALLGAAIGGAGERWDVVSTDHLQVSFAITGTTGAGAGVSLRF